MTPFVMALVTLGLLQDAAPTGEVPRCSLHPAPKQLVTEGRPEYPEKAFLATFTGTVVTEVTIGTDGSVSDVRVLKGIPFLTEAAVAWVRKLRFEPVVVDGSPTACIITLPVTYNAQTATPVRPHTETLIGLLESKDVASIEYTADFVAAQANRFGKGDKKKLAKAFRGVLATEPSETLASAVNKALAELEK